MLRQGLLFREILHKFWNGIARSNVRYVAYRVHYELWSRSSNELNGVEHVNLIFTLNEINNVQ